MCSEKLRNLHNVTKFKRPVVVRADKEIFRVFKLKKLRNRTEKVCSSWKESILAIFQLMWQGHSYLQYEGKPGFEKSLIIRPEEYGHYLEKLN